MNELKNKKLVKIKGVGPKKEQLLSKININSIYDLIKYYPRSYEDLSSFSLIKDCYGEKGLFSLKVISEPNLRRVKGNMTILTVNVSDGDTTAELIFFNQPFMQNYFRKDYKIFVYGAVKKNGFVTQITNVRLLRKNEIGRLEPVYSLTAGMSNNELLKIITNGYDAYNNYIVDYIPEDLIKKYDLMNLKEAIYNIHFPKNKELLKKARRRLSFDELFILQYSLEKNKFRDDTKISPTINVNKFKKEINDFIESLEFNLTKAQIRVYGEIFADMESQNGMNRLLQGDVGSGKTVIAALSILLSALNGYQSAMMVPTEVLAKQHYRSISKLFKDKKINIELLTGDLSLKEKERVTEELKSGKIDVIIGTHALIQDTVSFHNLGLTIIDEQHRFGVEQRKTLYLKGNHPNNLVMSATPIPRTLALVIYGDMDISIIDELPPGRKVIDTFAVNYSYIQRLDKFVMEQIENGRQVFVVCPLIEENDMPLKSLEEVYSHYSSNKFTERGIKSKFLHGKLKNDEKNDIMLEFLNNDFQILVSTTVIEVGINVPNANLMIVYDADRFGLSQLHQLRGRVGRGDEKSYCVLINNNDSELSYRRMKVMQQSNDGFYIAEKDLELRGQGELLGTRQHGASDLKIANLLSDSKLIEFIKSNFDNILKEIQKYPHCLNELDNYLEI